MILGIIFIVAILGAVTYIAINWDTVFKSNVEITYPDGCIEFYENSNLVSPECVEGRELVRNPNAIVPLVVPSDIVLNITLPTIEPEDIIKNETMVINETILNETVANETEIIEVNLDEIRKCLDRCTDRETQKCVDEYSTTSMYNDTVTDEEILNHCSFAVDFDICREECDVTNNS